MSEAPKDKVTHGYYRSKDAEDRNHGVCFEYMAVGGKLEKVLHAAVFHHGVVAEILPVNFHTVNGKKVNGGVKLYELKRAAADFKKISPRKLEEVSTAPEKTLPVSAPALIAASAAPGAAA